MAIFLDQGMVAWMLACSWVASTIQTTRGGVRPPPRLCRMSFAGNRLGTGSNGLKQGAGVYP